MLDNPFIRTGKDKYVKERIAHWDSVAKRFEHFRRYSHYYHHRVEYFYQFLIPKGSKVIELGCGDGSLLASIEPSKGVGVDFSIEMIGIAKKKHPHLEFLVANAEDVQIDEVFDVIIMSDLVNDLWDVQATLRNLKRNCGPHTRIIINCYSRLWQPILSALRLARMATPLEIQNWLTTGDIKNLFSLEGFEAIKEFSDTLVPLNLPYLSQFANRFLSKIQPFKLFSLTNYVIGRLCASEMQQNEQPSVSVIIAARNEEKNIEPIFHRTPEMGRETELIFVEGGSSDNTFSAIEKAIAANPQRKASVFKQPEKGKGDAVRTGFDKAKGDILMILDADMTVPPEDLTRFYDALVENKGDFINGVRLVYPMEKESMRFFNLVGNKFFSIAFSWLLGQPVKDTLCGTKVLTKKSYNKIALNRSYFGHFDPFGDFDLLFGAAKLNFKIIDLPIRYQERVYGDTNIQRWRHGLLLFRMAIYAAKRIKFI